MQSHFDLGYYDERLPDVLKGKYDNSFEEGRREIDDHFKRVRSGRELLSVEDVMAIFSDSLPYVSDWTKPDEEQLNAKINRPGRNVAVLVKELRDRKDTVKAISEILSCLRELSLTSLILHHVYPDRFAICSHHLASLLNIAGRTVSSYYVAYCDELGEWSKGEWPRNFKTNVVGVEFALWTWYRLASYGKKEDQKDHRNKFFNDPWINERRALRIAGSIGEIGKLALARSYLDTDPTVCAIIAWRELASEVKKALLESGQTTSDRPDFPMMVSRLPDRCLPDNVSKAQLIKAWVGRNDVMHDGKEVAEPKALAKERAMKLLDSVTDFAMHNTPRDSALDSMDTYV